MKNSKNLNTWGSSSAIRKTGSTSIRFCTKLTIPRSCLTWWPICKCSMPGWATMSSSSRRSLMRIQAPLRPRSSNWRPSWKKKRLKYNRWEGPQLRIFKWLSYPFLTRINRNLSGSTKYIRSFASRRRITLNLRRKPWTWKNKTICWKYSTKPWSKKIKSAKNLWINLKVY